MGDLSKDYINRIEQSFEIPVNPMNIGCEDRSCVASTMILASRDNAKNNQRAVPEGTAR
jgi:hypothetical protein